MRIRIDTSALARGFGNREPDGSVRVGDTEPLSAGLWGAELFAAVEARLGKIRGRPLTTVEEARLEVLWESLESESWDGVFHFDMED